MRLVVALLLSLFLVQGVVSERVFEEGRDQRLQSHHTATFEEPLSVDGDDEIEDVHRGIPMVEDDVPEWLRLTFADKFIALGEGEFISLGENVDRSEIFGDEDEGESHHSKRNQKKEESESEYEYVYSDEEGFVFDPTSDELVGGPESHHHHKEDSVKEYEYSEESEEQQPRQRKTSRHKPVAVPIHGEKRWQKQVEKGVSDAVSLLETGETETANLVKSHQPGSRRARKQQYQQKKPNIGKPAFGGRMEYPYKQHQLPERFVSGKVGLNPSDPRLQPQQDNWAVLSGVDNVAFMQVDDKPLPLAEESQQVANNHKEWLRRNTPPTDVQLPKLERHMYSNGLPVADWEVGYVDNVLKQFGY